MEWSVHAGSGQRVCAACARHAASNGGELPTEDALQERRRQEAQRKRQLQELRQQEEAGAERRCMHCGTAHSKPWRLDLLIGERLCNSCRSWQEKHGGELPPPEVVQKRMRLQRQRQLEAAGVTRKSFCHCGTESSPDGWLVHPTQDGRICGRCNSYHQQYLRLPDEDVLARRRQRDAERAQGQRCSHCGSAETSGTWGRHPETRGLLCHYCNAYRREEQGRMPSPDRLLLRDVEREQRRREEAEGGEPCCSHCGATGQREYRWHSQTRVRLCIPCGNYEKKHGGQLPPAGELAARQQREAEREGQLPRRRQRRQQPEQQGQQAEQQERRQPAGQEQRRQGRQRRPEGEQEQEQEEQLRCSHCSSEDAAGSWCRHPTTRQRLCKWCFTHQQKQGGELPPASLIERQEREQRRREAAVEEKRCTHCGSLDGGLWRRDRITRALLCSRCGGWTDNHAGVLPPPEVILQRQQRLAVQQAEAAQAVKRCTHCLSQDSGGLRRRHPETSVRLCLLCTGCLERTGRLPDEATLQQRQAQRQRRQQARAAASLEPEQEGQEEEQQQQEEAEQQRSQGEQEQPRQEQQQRAQVEQELQEEDEEQQQQQQGEACSHCGDDASKHKRRHPVTNARLCASCRKYVDKHVQLPPVDLVQRRQQRRQQREREAGSERSCSHCGVNGPAVAWRRHPTSQLRICEPCCHWQQTHGGELPPADVLERRQQHRQDANGQGGQQQQQQQSEPQSEAERAAARQPTPALQQQQQEQQQAHQLPDLQQPPKQELLAQPKAEGGHPPLRQQQRQGEEPKQEAPVPQRPQQEPPAPQQQRRQQEPQQAPAVLQQQEPPAQQQQRRRRPQQEPLGRSSAEGDAAPSRQHGSNERPKPPARGRRPLRPPVQRQCLECGSDSKGAGRCSTWRRHPVTKAEWLCQACYCKASQRARLEQLRRQQLGDEEDSEGEEEGAAAMPQKERQQQRQRQPVADSEDEDEEAEAAAVAAGRPAGKRPRRQQARDAAAAAPKRQRRQAQPQGADVTPETADTPQKRKANETGSRDGKRQRQGGGPTLASLLEAAAGQAAAAATGLTPELVAAFLACLADQTAEDRAAKEGQLRSLLEHQRLDAAVELMQAAVRQEGSGADEPAAADVAALGAAAPAAIRRRVPSQRQARQQAGEQPKQQGQRTRAQRAQQAQQPKPDPDAEPALARLLREAARGEAAAAEGLTPELVAAFLRLLPRLGPRERADKEGALTHMVQRWRFAAAAAAMRAAVERAGAA